MARPTARSMARMASGVVIQAIRTSRLPHFGQAKTSAENVRRRSSDQQSRLVWGLGTPGPQVQGFLGALALGSATAWARRRALGA